MLTLKKKVTSQGTEFISNDTYTFNKQENVTSSTSGVEQALESLSFSDTTISKNSPLLVNKLSPYSTYKAINLFIFTTKLLFSIIEIGKVFLPIFLTIYRRINNDNKETFNTSTNIIGMYNIASIMRTKQKERALQDLEQQQQQLNQQAKMISCKQIISQLMQRTLIRNLKQIVLNLQYEKDQANVLNAEAQQNLSKAASLDAQIEKQNLMQRNKHVKF